MIKVMVDKPEDLAKRLTAVVKRMGIQWDWSVPAEIQVRPFQSVRSRGQNSLYWRWMGEIALELTDKKNNRTKDDMHDLLRWKFLGTEEVNIAGEVITRLPSTTGLTKSQMAHYMGQVEAWSADMGILLPIPADNDYTKYREASQ